MAYQNNQDIKKLLIPTVNALNAGRLIEAISLMRSYLETNPDSRLSDRLNELDRNYGFMLDYFAKGNPDPERLKLYSSIREDLFGMIRTIEYQKNIKDSPELYYSTARNMSIPGKTFDSLLKRYITFRELITFNAEVLPDNKLLSNYEQSLRDLFDFTWSLPPGSTKVIRNIVETINNNGEDYPLCSQLVSALTIGGMRLYDRNKLIALLDIDENCNNRLSARSLVGIVLILYRHSKRLNDDSVLHDRFDLWSDNLMNYHRLREVIYNLIRTIGSLDMVRNLQNSIMPDLLRNREDIMEKLNGLNDVTSLSDFEENPEWEEMMNNSGLKDKMNEIESLQRDGADLMLMGLGQMKYMPFFNHISNWFLPFSLQNTNVITSGISSEDTFGKMLVENDTLCDSDKFSFALILSKIPDNQRTQIQVSLSAQQEQMAEELKERMLKSSAPEFDKEITNYVRSLYRFYNFFRLKSEFPSPLSDIFDFTTLPFIGNMMQEREILQTTAEYYFHRKNYSAALPLFLRICENVNEGVIHEKIGYCYLCNKQFKEALTAFEKAELLNTRSKWLRKNIAKASLETGNLTKAIEYYEKELSDDPENLQLLYTIANLYMTSGNYDHALKLLYKIDYLNSSYTGLKNRIAEANLLNKDFAKASASLEDLLSLELINGNTSDINTILSAGDAQWGLGNIHSSLNHYRNAWKSHSAKLKSIRELQKIITDRWKKLPSGIFSAELIPMIIDWIDKN